ncbi:MAG: DUF58 domain-containing protein [Opitutaceae bacterium]
MIAPASNRSLASASLIEPKALMTIRSLELRAKAVVEGFWNGSHRSPYHGFSVEFTEYRQYTPGDDLRYLDWKVFARSDRYFIKKFEDETNLRCQLVVDQSQSMNYGSLSYTKAHYAATLAATLAYFLHLQGDAVGLLTFDEAVRDFMPARHRADHLRQIMITLEKPAGGKTTDLVAPLERVAQLVRKRGLVVVVSDFLAPLEKLERSLLTLAASGQELAVFQVLDPTELTLQFDQPMLFKDIESDREIYIDPSTARASYVEKIKAHSAALKAVCQKLGATHYQLMSDQPLELALFEFLQERMRRGRAQTRNRS